MRRCDRLVMGAFLSRGGITVVACWGLYSAVELVDLVNLRGAEAWASYPYRLPLGLVLVSPLGLLAGACWTALYLLRSGQLTALAALGQGGRRSLGGLVALGGLWGMGLWTVAQSLVPWGLARPDGQRWETGPVWLRQGPHLMSYEPMSSGAVQSLVVIALDPAGLPRWRLEADEARRQGQGWHLLGVTRYRPGQAPEQWTSRRSPVDLVFPPPTTTPPETMDWLALRHALALAPANAMDPLPWATELALRWALALACPVCLLLGLVAGAGTGGHPPLAWLAAALGGLGYWALLAPCWALTRAGALSPGFLQWAPAAVVGCCAVLLYARALRSPWQGA